MRRALAALLSLLLIAQLSGCVQVAEEPSDPRYVAISFAPLYALAVNVMDGVDGLSLSCLIQPQDGCLRLYELSEWDAARVEGLDVLILGGRGLESFEGLLYSLGTGPAIVSLMEGMVLLEGGAEAGDEEEVNHLHGPNPWLFLCVDGAKLIVDSMATAMETLDAPYAARYAANADAFLARLDALEADMAAQVAGAPEARVALLHEGLIYLADELSLDVCLQFAREPGTDWIGNDLQNLLDALAQARADVVLIEAQAPAHLLAALSEAGYRVAALDTLTSSAYPGDPGAYERAMLENARRVAQALRGA